MSLKPYYEKRGLRLYQGDCREILPALSERFETAITDPPYEISFMGRAWDRRGVSFDPATWKAVLGALKPGASLLSFGGTRTWHRIACAIEDAGFEIRDCLMWLYGGGFPKSLDISKSIDRAAGAKREVVGVDEAKASRLVNQMKGTKGGTWPAGKRDVSITAPATDPAKVWNGWGTALKPAFEPVILAMAPLDGTFADNAIRHGVAGLDIDATRIPGPKGNGHWSGEDGSDGTSKPGYEGGFKKGGSSRPGGRWPSNVVLDDEAASLLDAQTGELKSGDGVVSRKASSGYKGNAYGTENRPAGTPHVTYGDRGGASRFFYVAKAKWEGRGDLDYAAMPLFGVGPSSDRNDHPTCKPVDLLRYLCLLTRTPTGGVVVDPFAGSGTTLVAARLAGRPSVGIELEEKYCEIAAKRLDQPITL